MPGNKINDLIASHQAKNGDTPFVSFEYFPPRTEDGVKNLMERMTSFREQEPLFVDMTWGAGGSTSDLTLELCTRMFREHSLEPNMHLTCTNMEAEKVDKALEGAKAVGIRNIVALRGDPPEGKAWTAVEGGFKCGLDLVRYIREKHGDFFCIAVAGYPEGHPNVIKKVEDESKLTDSERSRVFKADDGLYVCSDEDYKNELAYLKQKVDAGGNLVITQMFFDVPLYAQFVADCKAIGINVPIVPGIMCISAYAGFKKMTGFCKTHVSKSLEDSIEAIKDNADAVKAFGIDFGVQMCQELIKVGAPGLHFYTLNLSKTTFSILEKLGMLKQAAVADAVAQQ